MSIRETNTLMISFAILIVALLSLDREMCKRLAHRRTDWRESDEIKETH